MLFGKGKIPRLKLCKTCRVPFVPDADVGTNDLTAEGCGAWSCVKGLAAVKRHGQVCADAILVSGKSTLDASDFDAQYLRPNEPVKASDASSLAGMTLDEIERQTILQALDRHKGNLSQVAMTLGISRAALYRRLEKFNITVTEK